MEDALNLLPPGTPRITDNTPNPERMRVSLVSVTPLSLGHLLREAPFLSPANTWHILDEKVQAMGTAQLVGPFTKYLRACTVSPPRRIDNFIKNYLLD